MSIKKHYALSGLLIGIAVGFSSLPVTVPLSFGVFGLFLFATENAIIPIVGIPLAIYIAFAFTGYFIGLKVGRKREVDIQNGEKNKWRAKSVLFVALIVLLLGIATFVLGVSKIISSYKTGLAEGQKSAEKGKVIERTFEEYATIGDVAFELLEPWSYLEAVNGQIGEVSVFKKLVFTVPVTVSRSGTYRVHMRYEDAKVGALPSKEVVRALPVGVHRVVIEFPQDESKKFGYFSPKSAQAVALVQLSYLASSQELQALTGESNTLLEKKAMEAFMRFEGGTVPSAVYKFVGKKEIQF